MYSFYIPRISRTYTEEQIKIIFSFSLMIGQVKRVDFVPINKKLKRAFVHMDIFYNLDTAKKIKHIVFEQGKPFRVFIGPLLEKVEETFGFLFSSEVKQAEKERWVLLKNKTPIDDTNMNIHQLADRCNTIIQYVTILNHRIEKIEYTMKPVTVRPLGCLIDKMFDNPFS